MRGEKGGPVRLVRDKMSSQFPTVEAARHSWDVRRQERWVRCDIKTSLCTEYVLLYTVCYPTVSLITITMNDVLSVYLFQESKSYGSKKPFAFIL
jgi:hypothetical protein